MKIIQNICNEKIDQIIEKLWRSKNNSNSNTASIYFKFVNFPSIIDQVTLSKL